MSVTARKIITVGHSSAIIIPPWALTHLNAKVGNLLGWDLTADYFAILSVVSAPPTFTHPQLFEQPYLTK